MQVTVIYDNLKDRKLFELVSINIPVFFNFLDLNTTKGHKEGTKIKGYYGAKKNPFVEVKDNLDSLVKVFYSENGNAINQFITWINDNGNKN